MNRVIGILYLFTFSLFTAYSQALRIPNDTNFSSGSSRRIGNTSIDIRWNSPGVKGRDGKIWGTDVAHFGYQVLGFGSNVASPWRAGADECTTISFSTNVNINGQQLEAGNYALFLELQQDSSTFIFNRNVNAWGSYFYDSTQDVLKVKVAQQKNTPFKERLEYIFRNQTPNSVEVALEWERWSLPFTVTIDRTGDILASIKSQLSGELGFDPPSLIAGARWCLNNKVNEAQALDWIQSATDPNLGGTRTFTALSIQAGLLKNTGKISEGETILKEAIEVATAIELHGYGRQLLQQRKLDEAMQVFEKNYHKQQGAWPTNVGMMRVLSAKGDYTSALKYAKQALQQAPDQINQKSLEENIRLLEEGKPVK